MKRDFEKFLSLPWAIQRKGTWEHINSHNGEGLNICIMPYTDIEWKKAARQYLVLCANLMPECAEALKQAKKELAGICEWCNTCPSNGRKLCETGSAIENITALLAKLEGGAEE